MRHPTTPAAVPPRRPRPREARATGRADPVTAEGVGRDYLHLDGPVDLATAMRARGLTVRRLAADVSALLGRPVSPALIGHLRSGRRSTCHVDVATAIDWVLREAGPVPLLWRARP